MNVVEMIARKREGLELTRGEIELFIEGYTRDEIPDYQAAAWAMAVAIRGMSAEETEALTLAMAYSGDTLYLKDIAPFIVDKHSTGGVGDKVSLVVAPLVAACGLPVGKMSGRGLGFSGGTLDKLDSIPDFRTDLSVNEFRAQLARIGVVLTGQTADLAPADRKLYALRDVTATVSSLPLIVSSIMSKKIAAGADGIVLDVKVGSGAFMKTLDEARALAQACVDVGTRRKQRVGRRIERKIELKLKMTALISDMNQPLGWAVGNALELHEAIDALHERGPQDLLEHCLVVAGEMLALGNKAPNAEAGTSMAQQALASGAAWRKFLAMVEAQDGDLRSVEEPDRLPRAPLIEVVPAPQDGYLAAVDTDEIGMAVVDLGGGRRKKGDTVDPAVGVVVHAKVGERVERGAPLFAVHARDRQAFEAAAARILAAHHFSEEKVAPLPLFYDRITD